MKKNRVKILLIAIIVPVLLTGCGVSPEQLAAKGIYPEEYRADSLAANIENAVLNGENKLETLYFAYPALIRYITRTGAGDMYAGGS